MLYFFVKKYYHGTERYVHHVVDSKTAIKRNKSFILIHRSSQILGVEPVALGTKKLKPLFEYFCGCHDEIMEKRRSNSN
jgi:predicted SprT family Zn-dependent metalloprotease